MESRNYSITKVRMHKEEKKKGGGGECWRKECYRWRLGN